MRLQGGKSTKRARGLYERLISRENLELAVLEVAKPHRWYPGHRPNMEARAMEADVSGYADKLRDIIESGFAPSPVKVRRRWDKSAGKWRDIAEPRLWPDQVVHHAMIQVLVPVLMRGMDYWCCGSIRGRGASRGKAGIERWIREDHKGTRWCLSADIRHFYDSLRPEVTFSMLRRKIKDHRFMNLVWAVIGNGFLIGAYYSQWMANFTLQALDRMIRQQPGVAHYVRYMDNFTVFGPNKRKLHKLRRVITDWLEAHGLHIKGDWQIYRTKIRQPEAMGYRYSVKGTRLKQRNALRLKRQLSACRRKMQTHKRITARFAAGLLSRLGQLRRCRAVTFYRLYVPKGLQHILKNIIRKEQKKWSTSLGTVS